MKNGLVHIYTGDGKGKTTAALGLAFRAAGHEKKTYILQFLKGRKTGELNLINQISKIKLEKVNKTGKFYIQMNKKEKMELKNTTQQAWNNLRRWLIDDQSFEIIILDELLGALHNKLVSIKQVITLIREKPSSKELILTGRGAPDELIEMADYVTEMKMVKHPYQKNISARKGIEF